MKNILRRITAKLLVWWTVRELRRSFAWAVTLPRNEAMLVITRWRWRILHAEAIDDEIRTHYLLALTRLEQIINSHESGLAEAA